MRRSGSLLAALLVLVGSASCLNPTHHDASEAQGGDPKGAFAGISPGPTHRAGQQCSVCHGGDGPGPDFSFSGTIFATRNGTVGLSGVNVIITDATSTSRTVVTNEVGNFYISTSDFKPLFPALISLSYTDPATNKTTTQNMISRIGGNGGCAFCHYGSDNETFHMPPVYAKNL